MGDLHVFPMLDLAIIKMYVHVLWKIKCDEYKEKEKYDKYLKITINIMHTTIILSISKENNINYN
jgi:hypothetical protein